MIQIDDIDAEAVVLQLGLADWVLLVERLPELVKRGLRRDLASALRHRWVGSRNPLSQRWASAVGMSGLASTVDFARCLDKRLDVVEDDLANLGVSVPDITAPVSAQYDLAAAVFTTAVSSGIEAAAEVYGIRVQESALYRRRFARMRSELPDGATEDEARSLWDTAWAVRPELLRKPWTPSPAHMFDILAGGA